MRTTYRNGDPISLGNCDGCNPIRINGILCHEARCPHAWRDELRECLECGFEFLPADPHQTYCSEHCAAMHRGHPCCCDLCLEIGDELAALESEEEYTR